MGWLNDFWRKLQGAFDPYYQLSPEEAERLIVCKSQYLNALWSLQRARDCLDSEIFYLQLRIDQIDQALEAYPDSFFEESKNA